MALTPGMRLGSFEISALLGEASRSPSTGPVCVHGMLFRQPWRTVVLQLAVPPRDIPRATSLRLILNWFDDVRRLAGANW